MDALVSTLFWVENETSIATSIGVEKADWPSICLLLSCFLSVHAGFFAAHDVVS